MGLGRLGGLAAAVLASAALVAGPGCGGDDPNEPASTTSTTAPSARPADFAITVEHTDGTVAPPYHDEWTLAIEAGGQATLTYVPDYPGKGVPEFRNTFTVDDAQMDALYEDLQEHGLLDEDIKETDDPPIGGSVDTATVTADGKTIEIPAFSENGDPVLEPLMPTFEKLVPAAVWRSMGKRRLAYIKRHYDEVPDVTTP